MPKYHPKERLLKKDKKPPKLIANRVLATDVILFGISNERSARLMEKDNTLTFRCRTESTKLDIKSAFIELYNHEVVKVNTVNTIKGYKKAYIRLKEEGAALKVANDAEII